MRSLSCDVIIVGAGPAGSTAARFAAEKGANVLLIDKKIDIGVPVKCAELLPTPAEMKKLTPDAKGIDELFTVPDKYIANRTRHMRFIYPNLKEVEVKFEVNILERKLFDKFLACEAVRAGAEIRVMTKAIGFPKDDKGIVARSGSETLEIRAKVIVGADGPLSTIARLSGLEVPRDPIDIGTGLQYEMARIDVGDEETCEMYFGKEYAPGGYGWIFPKGNGIANVGVSIRSPYMKGDFSIRDYLNHFIKKHPTASKKLRRAVPIAIRAGIVPIGGPIPKTFTENVIVVGDAASQALPHVGGGVPSALICGRIAGEVSAERVSGLSTLSEYELRWKKEIGGTLENALKLRKIGDAFFKSDKAVDFLTKRGWINEENLKKFVYCKVDRPLLLMGQMLSKLVSF